MKRIVKKFLFALAIALLPAMQSCGYFNSLYNANRQFADAERARGRGELTAAQTAYTSSIEKAAKSYRKYPNGRWADDALYLIARARFRLGEFDAARAAFEELLAKTTNGSVRAGAHGYAGAAALRLNAPTNALAHLDSAVAQLDDGDMLHGFARLWRARARAAAGDAAGAWSDLDAVTSAQDAEFGAVQLERIAIALELRDSAHLASAFAGILTSRDARRHLDTVRVFAHSAVSWLGAPAVRTLLDVPQTDMVAAASDSLVLIRAQLAVDAGDTATANQELLSLAERAGGVTAAVARIAVARNRLRSLHRLEQLGEIRALLLPAIAAAEAQILIRSIRLVDVMVRRSAQTGQPLALFAAAEIARDDLGAPHLAYTLFRAYAEVGAQTPWAAKALLAAVALDPVAPDANDLRDRLQSLPPNPYTQVVSGAEDQGTYETAEERLTRSLIALKSEASVIAQQQETVVSEVIATLDSVTAAARADTVRASCGLMIDTLGVTGIRADSVRTACLRSDSVNVAAYIKADTAKWLLGASKDERVNVRRRNAPKTARDTVIR